MTRTAHEHAIWGILVTTAGLGYDCLGLPLTREAAIWANTDSKGALNQTDFSEP